MLGNQRLIQLWHSPRLGALCKDPSFLHERHICTTNTASIIFLRRIFHTKPSCHFLLAEFYVWKTHQAGLAAVETNLRNRPLVIHSDISYIIAGGGHRFESIALSESFGAGLWRMFGWRRSTFLSTLLSPEVLDLHRTARRLLFTLTHKLSAAGLNNFQH